MRTLQELLFRTIQTQILQNLDREQLHNNQAMVNLHMMAKRASTPVRDRAIHIVHSYQVLLFVLFYYPYSHVQKVYQVWYN